mgnify:CR=1 FL=1
MRTFHIHIKADSDEDLKTELKEAAYILTGLHESTKKWQSEYGSQNRADMQRWQNKAQEWVDKHKKFITD